jgi:hypothetical protein
LEAIIKYFSSKPARLNTVVESKQKWDAYVEKEGLKEDLQQKHKDGYLDKIEFLNKTDENLLRKRTEYRRAQLEKRLNQT